MRFVITGLVLVLSTAVACSVPDKAFDGDAPGKDAGEPDATPDTTPTDTSPPDTVITMKPPAVDNSTTVAFEFTSTESGSVFECSMDSPGFVPCPTPPSFGGLVGGSHTFKVRAIDQAGNTDPTPAAYAWTIDTSTPDTVIDSAPGVLVNSTSAQFAFSSPTAGNGATYECLVDGDSFASCSSPKMYTSLAEGTHQFRVRVRNAAGTYDATPAGRSWTIDVTPPDTMIASGPPNPTQLSIASFDLSSSDAGVSYECSLDSAAFTACPDPYRTSIGNGAHTMRVRARDGAGNVDASPATYAWTSALANLVFITPSTISNLGGLAGGDNLCASRAQFAGLLGTYRAWLSTTSVNAIDRLGSAREWIRVDGKPFVDTLANLVAGKIYYPLTLDAGGTFVDASVMTGTGADGKYTAADGSCMNWTSVDDTQTRHAGFSSYTSQWWTGGVNATSSCGVPASIYCFGIDFTTQVAPPAPTGRIVFLTASKWLPGGGLASADGLCASEASAAGLAGTFKAALATANAGSLARLSSTGPRWVRVDGAAITNTTAELFDGQLSHLAAPINVTAAGAYVAEASLFSDPAWTGPRLVGSTRNCADWTSSASGTSGAVAFNAATQMTTEFSDGFTLACNAPHRLFCFQQ